MHPRLAVRVALGERNVLLLRRKRAFKRGIVPSGSYSAPASASPASASALPGRGTSPPSRRSSAKKKSSRSRSPAGRSSQRRWSSAKPSTGTRARSEPSAKSRPAGSTGRSRRRRRRGARRLIGAPRTADTGRGRGDDRRASHTHGAPRCDPLCRVHVRGAGGSEHGLRAGLGMVASELDRRAVAPAASR